MLTLFRMATILSSLVFVAYATLWAIATFVHPMGRDIVQDISPLSETASATRDDGPVLTGRSAAGQLNGQVSLLAGKSGNKAKFH